MRTKVLAATILTALAVAGGCNRSSPFVSNRGPYNGAPPYAWQGSQPSGGGPQGSDAGGPDIQFRQQANRLEADNSDLHKQVAQSQQQVQVLTDQVNLLRKQLAETVAQNREKQQALAEAEKKLQGALASTRQRGGASLTANNSLKSRLEPIEIPGLTIRSERDVIRIELPADQLFRQGTAQFQPAAPAILSRVADAVRRNFARQRVVVEGHASANPTSGTFATSSHRQTADQSMAVLDQLTTTGGLHLGQLSTMALGANHPLATNATPEGRARNRRIEVVIYPEKIGE